MHQIIDAGIAPQRINASQWVVAYADDFVGHEVCELRPARQLRGFDEFRVLMCAFGQQLQQVFGANDGEKIGFEITVERREEDMPARFDKRGASADDAGRMLAQMMAAKALRSLTWSRERLNG